MKTQNTIAWIFRGVDVHGNGAGGKGRRDWMGLPKGTRLKYAMKEDDKCVVIKTTDDRYFTLTREAKVK